MAEFSKKPINIDYWEKRQKFREEKVQAEDHAPEDAASERIADPHIGWEGGSTCKGGFGAGEGVFGSANEDMSERSSRGLQLSKAVRAQTKTTATTPAVDDAQDQHSAENENETIETLQATLKRLTEEIRVLQYVLKDTAKRQCTGNAINPTSSGAAAMEYTQSESQAMYGAGASVRATRGQFTTHQVKHQHILKCNMSFLGMERVV